MQIDLGMDPPTGNSTGNIPDRSYFIPDDWRISIMQYPEELLGTILGMFLGTFPVSLLFLGTFPTVPGNGKDCFGIINKSHFPGQGNDEYEKSS